MALSQTDPELLKQLDEAKGTDDPVNAVVRLRRKAGVAPEPAKVEEQMQAAIERTAEATGEHPVDVNVMGRLAVAYVSGSERFVREFVEQPEVASAVANEADGDSSAKIAPAPGASDELGEAAPNGSASVGTTGGSGRNGRSAGS